MIRSSKLGSFFGRFRRKEGFSGILGLAALSPLFLIAPADAHPHVWVSMTAELLFTPDGKLSAIDNVWKFDEGYSTYAVQGIPTEADGSITRATLDVLAKSNTDALDEFGYFTLMRIDGKKQIFGAPQNYWFEYRNTALTYHMTLPLKEPVKPGKVTMIEIYDPTYFVSFAFPDTANPVTMPSAPKGCAMTIARPKIDPQPTQTLNEAFFNSVAAGTDVGASFSSRIVLACP